MIVEEKKSLILIVSMLAAVFASTASLTQILLQLLSGFQGSIMTLLYIGVTGLILLFGLFLQRNRYWVYNTRVFILAFILLLYYVLTDTFIGAPLTEMAFFLVFTIVAFVVPSLIAVDEKIFMRTVIYLSILGLPFVNDIFVFDYNDTISMGNSYAFLFPVMTTLVYFTHYFKSDSRVFKILDLIALIANVVYFFMMITYGSRGPIVCILAYLVYFLVIHEYPHRVSLRKGRLFLIILLGVIFLVNFVPILTMISKGVEQVFNVNLNFIEKFIRMSYAGDMTNGRDSITRDTIAGILDKPLFGHGCDLFYLKHYHIYPHNFILQMLYDMGIIASVIFLAALFRKFKTHLKYRYNKDKFVLLMLLCFASVPGAMFSSDLWNNVVLWFFFGSVFSKTFSYNANLSKLKL